MRRVDRRLVLAAVAAGAALAAWMGATVALVAPTLDEAQRRWAADLLLSRLPLLLLAWAVAAALVARLLVVLHRRLVLGPSTLLDAARVVLHAGQAPPMPATGSAVLRELGAAIAALAAQRDALRGDLAQEVARASAGLQQERNRLAALVADLTQGVVVCNLDGRIVLYNQRARLQLRALSQAPRVAGGAELVGIGRSVYGVVDRRLVAHALETISRRLDRGAASPSTQFVTGTAGGQLLRVQMVPVRSGDAVPGAAPLAGFVLTLDNVSRESEQDLLRDRLLHGLAESARSSLVSLQAALDRLALPAADPATRESDLAAMREEVAALGRRVAEASQEAAQGIVTRWPLEDMLGTDLLSAAARWLEDHCGRPVAVDAAGQDLWVRVDSVLLLQALASLAGRVVEDAAVRHLQLRLGRDGGRAVLDLAWGGHPVSAETAAGWEFDAVGLPGQSLPLSVREVVQRHGGELSFHRDRVRHEAMFRFLLPLEAEEAPVVRDDLPGGASRPEFFDFDLFRDEPGGALDERPLAALAYTVFDTETTGLSPSGGDQVIQIGAVRVVAGRLLRQEGFEQLVDPGRGIPPATIPIHGITPEMVAGQPRIAEVLPAFHAYAHDTVLVAHNAAFDLKFLQLQEAATGLSFHQPVLDTLLLSAVVHPDQASHRLEDIALRLGVPVLGRHTALGDALVTAEVLLRLLPLLEAKGVRTLRQAREASQRTWYARLQY